MPSMEYFEPSYHPQYHHDPMAHYANEHQYMGHQSAAMIPMPNPTKTSETKPRLGKDEVDILERAFIKNPKPTTQTKRQFAEDMGVDLARINNWFQNRRAKRKQEKKQEAYEANQAQDASVGSEPSSPDTYNNSVGYYSDEALVTIQQPATFPVQGPPPPAVSFIPQYPDTSIASMESIERTLAAAHGGVPKHEEFPTFIAVDEMPAFGAPLVHDFSAGDRAHFPVPDSRFGSGQSYTFPSNFSNTLYNGLSHPMSETHSSPEAAENTPTPFSYSSPPGSETNGAQSIIAAFPSQLLPAQSHESIHSGSIDGSCTQSPEDSNCSFDIAYTIAESNESLSSPPAPSIPFRSPPPMDIASRRKKVHVKPAALVADTLRGRPSMGPRTVSHAEGFRRPNDSPASSPMRRIHSAGGNRNVLTGRIFKSGVEAAQRSPINLGGFADAGSFIEHNYHTFRNPPSLAGGSSLSSSLAPPTPMSPREREMSFAKPDGARSTASPVEESLNFVFNASTGGFATVEGDQNLQSPPETPQAHLLLQQSTWPAGIEYPERSWNFEVPDEPQYTPAQDAFPTELHMPQPSMPHPSYLTSMSQPGTPGFGNFNPNFTFGHESPHFHTESPQYSMPMQPGSEYSFPDTHYPQGMSPTATKQKTFQFSHTTAADFSEK